MKSSAYDSPDAPLAAVFGDLSAAHRGRLLGQLAKTDVAVRGLVDRLKSLTTSNWATEGLTVEEYPGPPRKGCLSAYVDDRAGVMFALELVRGDFYEDLGRVPAHWYVEADVWVLPPGADDTVAALEMDTIECSTVDNAAIGLTLASGWLQSVIMSRPPTAEAWLADECDGAGDAHAAATEPRAARPAEAARPG